MASFLRALGSAVADYLVWRWGVPIVLGVVIAAVTIAPSDRGLVLALLLLVAIPMGITIATAYLGTLKARVRYLEHLEEEQGADPGTESIE